MAPDGSVGGGNCKPKSGDYFFFNRRIIHFRNIDTVKLTAAPIAASATFLSISPELMFTRTIVSRPPAIPAFDAGVKEASSILLLLKDQQWGLLNAAYFYNRKRIEGIVINRKHNANVFQTKSNATRQEQRMRAIGR